MHSSMESHEKHGTFLNALTLGDSGITKQVSIWLRQEDLFGNC